MVDGADVDEINDDIDEASLVGVDDDIAIRIEEIPSEACDEASIVLISCNDGASDEAVCDDVSCDEVESDEAECDLRYLSMSDGCCLSQRGKTGKATKGDEASYDDVDGNMAVFTEAGDEAFDGA